MKYLFSLLLLASLVTPAASQKFGHVNTAIIIQEHPNVATANTQLEAFQKSLVDPFKEKTALFQTKVQTFYQESNTGNLSSVQIQTRQAELQAEQKALAEEEDQIQFRILQKREEYLQPILTEVDSIIQSIGKEGRYTMIFDTSVAGALLFATESEDLTAQVQSKCMATKP